MKTLIAVAMILLAASAHAEGFYVETGLSVLQEKRNKPDTYYLRLTPAVYSDGSTRYTVQDMTVRGFSSTGVNDVSNPSGSLGFGYDIKWRSFVVDLKFQHESTLAGSDYGRNSARLSLRWYPFSP